MATANFRTMADFPLIVKGEEYIKVCPECYLSNSSEAEKCECGCDLSEVEAIVDESTCNYIIGEMEKVAAALNEAQPFYNVTVESGYYSGVQFYVDCKYCDIEDMSNEESRDEFGICRSECSASTRFRGTQSARDSARRRRIWDLTSCLWRHDSRTARHGIAG